MGDPSEQLSYKSTENIYSLFHFLLAGDFFEDHGKYSDFLDTMKDDKMIDKFRNLIHYDRKSNAIISCDEKFEDMYGHVTYEVEFAQEELT
jgi:hypothetical protein